MASSYAHLSPYNYADNDPINDFDIDGNQNNNTQQTPSSGGGSGGGGEQKATNVTVNTQTDENGNIIEETRTETTAQRNEDGSFTIHSVKEQRTFDKNGELSGFSRSEFSESGDNAEFLSEQGENILKSAFGEIESPAPTSFNIPKEQGLSSSFEINPLAPSPTENYSNEQFTPPSDSEPTNSKSPFSIPGLISNIKDFTISKAEAISKAVSKSGLGLSKLGAVGKFLKGLPYIGLGIAIFDALYQGSTNNWSNRSLLKGGVGVGIAVVGVAAAIAGLPILGAAAALAGIGYAIWDLSGGLDRTLDNYQRQYQPR